MPKKLISMFFYLALEMGIFSLILLQILALHPDYKALSWDMGILTWLFIAVILGWRIQHYFKINLPMHQKYLHSKLALFIWVLLFCYFMSFLLSTPQLRALFLSTMWLELALFLIGMGVFHYVKTRTEPHLSFRKWLQRQSFSLYIGIGIILLVGVSSMLFPLFRTILTFIPKSILFILERLAEHFEIFFFWLQYIVPEQADRGTEESEMVFELGEEEELVVLEPFSFAEMGDLPLILFLLAILGFILHKIWKQVKGMRFAYVEGDQELIPSLFKVLSSEKLLSAVTKKSKPKDRMRRQYQSLLQYAQKKGALIKQGDTARDWSLRLGTKNMGAWSTINQLYEQRRYGQEEISEEEMIHFEQEIKKMKKQIQIEGKRKR